MDGATRSSSISTRIYAVLLFLIALSLLYGGVPLARLGGSIYYLAAGLALAVCAFLLWRGHRAGAWLYAAILAATLAWAIWEVGFDGWALMPRLAAWFIVGAWMLTPWFQRSLSSASRDGLARHANWAGLAALLLGSVGVGGLLHTQNPGLKDPRFQAGVGAFPHAQMTAPGSDDGQWLHWGKDQGGQRFSPLAQITPRNVADLKVVWSAALANTKAGQGEVEATPLMVGNTLYACNGVNDVYAIDAQTGALRWRVAAADDRGQTCRGVAYYKVPNATGPCAERIYTATGLATLVALDAHSGQKCGGFGENGVVNLLVGISVAPRGYYHVTSAPLIANGKIVLGGWISDGQYWGEPSGVVRAFDALTGQLAWAWDMGRPDRTTAPPAGETYTPATPNSWAPMSADEALGLVYLPTGNATPDYFGAQRRPFDDKYSSSVVALDAATGKLRWSFQTTHHDLWDYDVASQPVLVDLPGQNGASTHALIQLTKRGEVFLLDRATGAPLRRVEERPAPQAGGVPEERLSPTQPYSVALPSFGGAPLRKSDMWGITPLDQAYCRLKFRQARYDGSMTPPGVTPWITTPAFMGGSNWGSASIDPVNGVMVLNSVRLANYNRLMTRAEGNARGLKPLGPDAPSIEVGGAVAQGRTPYAADIGLFFSPLKAPCVAPPFGYLSAVDLRSGKLIWSHPLGTARDSGPMGSHSHLPIPLGTLNIGGSMTTRSGLTFIGASMDRTLRAVDIRTGRELWRVDLPGNANATPMTYTAKDGRQMVAVSVSAGPGHGASLMAFALPERH